MRHETDPDSFIFYTIYPLKDPGESEPIPADISREAGYTLNQVANLLWG